MTGSWASHSISRPGCRPRSSSAMAGSRRAWPSPIGDETYSARLVRDGRGSSGGRSRRADEVPDELVEPYRVAGRRAVTAALEGHQPGVGALATAGPRSGPTIASAVPWRTSVGQRTCAHSSSARSSSFSQSPSRPSSDRLRVGLETPTDGVLDLLGGVRLGEDLREEELEIAGPVPQPIVTVGLRPALFGVESHRRTRTRLLLGILVKSRFGAISTRWVTRSGCSAARMSSSDAPHQDTTAARSTLAASSTRWRLGESRRS